MESIKERGDFSEQAAVLVYQYRQGKQLILLVFSPPMKAIVLSVDEKPSIQALERKTGYIETQNGKTMRAHQSTCKRNGTLNLFAALEVATGEVITSVTQTKTRQNFIQFG